MIDYYLQLEGVPGDSVAAGFEEHIGVLEWSWEQARDLTADEGAGSVRVGDFRITKAIDRATPKLMLACASGRSFEQAILRCVDAGRPAAISIFQVTLVEVRVARYSTTAPPEGRPYEHIGLAFTRIEFETTEQRSDGTPGGVIRTGWDNRLNEPC